MEEKYKEMLRQMLGRIEQFQNISPEHLDNEKDELLKILYVDLNYLKFVEEVGYTEGLHSHLESRWGSDLR